MIDNRIEAVIRTLRIHGVRCLLSGGQACVFYGAAEFSKDIDFVVLADGENFGRIEAAASSLLAETIAVPAFERSYLDEGLTIHLRCNAPPCEGLRLDLMSRLRGVDDFPVIWERRVVVEIGDFAVDLLGVGDLIASKKTQRAKDWPMIQRLAEVHYLSHQGNPTASDIELWLLELRTEELLLEAVRMFPVEAQSLTGKRPLLESAIAGASQMLRRELGDEIEAEKERDRVYWMPLKARLAELRREASRKPT